LCTAAFAQGASSCPVPAARSNPAEEEPAEHDAPEPQQPARSRATAVQRASAAAAPQGPARTFTVTWEAPEPLQALFKKHLPAPKPEEGERRGSTLRPWIRDIRRRVPEIAASEGYFSPTLDIDFADEARSQVVVKVVPGVRTDGGQRRDRFRGDLAGEGAEREARRRELRAAWTLTEGKPFRSGDWDVAKTRLAEELVDQDYAAGELVESKAVVDAEAATAALQLVLDSGPRFTIGDVEITGIKNYTEAVVRRSVDLMRGERYSVKRLQDVQRRIQEGPWFASVVVDVERDKSRTELVPVKLTVTERPRMDVGLALGYGTDDGARAEVAYRYRDLFDRGFDLQSSLRIAQERQIGYVDVYLPPGLWTSPEAGLGPVQGQRGRARRAQHDREPRAHALRGRGLSALEAR
jgi:translocation and assembly module TamA